MGGILLTPILIIACTVQRPGGMVAHYLKLVPCANLIERYK